MTTSVKSMKQNGFTLIEVMLVLAISGLLLLMTFFGQGRVRTQSQFRDSVEQFRAVLEKTKDDVNTGVAQSEESGCGSIQAAGRNANCVQFGTVVAFERDGSDYYTTHLAGLGPGSALPDTELPVQGVRPVSGSQNSLLWGSEFKFDDDQGHKSVVFTRHTATGKLRTHVFSENDTTELTGANPPSDAQVAQIINSTAGVEYTFSIVGKDCDAADIIINDPINTIRIEHKGKVSC